MDTLERESLEQIKLVNEALDLTSEAYDNICTLLKKIPHGGLVSEAIYNGIDALNSAIESLRAVEHTEVQKLLRMKF